MQFNLQSYGDLIQTGLDHGVQFSSFEKPSEYPEGKICILRHDIDIDMEAAKKMAETEHKLGVKSTYFLMLRSPVYNLFGRANNDFAREILDLGHDLGLHYDEGYAPEEGYDLNNWINKEVEALSSLLKKEIRTVSFHQPGENVLENRIDIRPLLNTYDKRDMAGIDYLSDSNMGFRRDPFALLEDPGLQKLQILIHPVWWMGGEQKMSTESLWDKALKDNFYRSQQQILATERAFGGPREIQLVQKENAHG